MNRVYGSSIRMVSQRECATCLDLSLHREKVPMKPQICCLLLLAMASCSVQDSKDRQDEDPGLVRLESRFPCVQYSFEILTAPGTELNRHQRCALVGAGYNEIAHGIDGRNGVYQADASAITRVTVAKYVFPDLDTGAVISYWSIDFDLGSKAYNVQVQLDAMTGKTSRVRAHK